MTGLASNFVGGMKGMLDTVVSKNQEDNDDDDE